MRRIAAVALVAAAACSNATPPAIPTPTPTPAPTSPSPSPSPSLPASPPAVPVFDAARAYRTVEALSVTIGARLSTGQSYIRAADLIAGSFASHGYTVRQQRVVVPAGTSAGRRVDGGESVNVIAEPPGFDPSRPHLLAGAHLDTVVGTPGANDNASGVAVLAELARLARLAPTAMPVVWVAFTAEERRAPGDAGAMFGSRAYLESMSRAQHDALRGVLIFDVVGRGPQVQASSGGTGDPVILDAIVAAARARAIPARKRIVAKLFSDHRPFEQAGFPVGWFYTGEFAQLHRSSDRLSVVGRDALARVGIVAWDVLRSLRL